MMPRVSRANKVRYRKEPEMGMETEPWWLTLDAIVGFEDDDSDDDGDDGEEETDDDDESENQSDDSDGDDGDEDEEDDEDDESKNVTQKDIRNLKKALRSERMARKKFERENKRMKAAARKNGNGQKDSDDKKDDEKEEAKGPSEREVRLAARLRDQEIDRVVAKVATRLKFVDPDDAVRLINRRDLDVNQDDEDPTVVDVDEEGVEDILRTIAKKKKYLVGQKVSTTKSGSKMSGGKKGNPGASDDDLKSKYKMNW
jgi:hypothetical protein